MSSLDLLLLNFEEVRRRSIKVWNGTPKEKLFEHYAGVFPTWLAPIQAKVLPVSENHLEYAKEVFKTLRRSGLRVELNSRDEKLGYKIREAQIQ
jgi:threonyl-tRNA synthetase